MCREHNTENRLSLQQARKIVNRGELGAGLFGAAITGVLMIAAILLALALRGMSPDPLFLTFAATVLGICVCLFCVAHGKMPNQSDYDAARAVVLEDKADQARRALLPKS